MLASRIARSPSDSVGLLGSKDNLDDNGAGFSVMKLEVFDPTVLLKLLEINGEFGRHNGFGGECGEN